MTEIEQKALELVNEVWPTGLFDLNHPYVKALCRAIEQHEAFRQEVSDTLEKRGFYIDDRDLGRFIIDKPDPLVEVLADMGLKSKGGYDWASEFRTTLARRGLEIREKAE